MAANRNVRVKKVEGEDDVYACNFTRRAFYNHDWDEYSSKARGLFLDHSGRVVMRGFDKFFNIGENDETTLEKVLDRVRYPATVELKQNGFLGLIGARRDGTLRFYSKSGQTDYSALVDEAFRNQLGNDPALIKRVHDVIYDHDVTIACEIIDHNSDRHIIPYDHSECFFIHCVRNDSVFSIDRDADDEIMNGIGWRNEDIRRSEVVSNREELADAINRAHGSDREGVVIYSRDGYMAKVKSDRYLRVKRLRHVLESRITHGDDDAHPRDLEDESALDYVLDHADMNRLVYERKAFHEDAVDMTYVGELLDEMDEPSASGTHYNSAYGLPNTVGVIVDHNAKGF
jgi:tRNA splicing ligase